MMQAEFEQALGISTPGERLRLNPEIYNKIEDMYMKSELEKSDFYLQVEKDRTIYEVTNKLINEKTASVKVLDTTSKWFGVTYAADRQSVVDKIQSLIDEGVYPNKLF